ncbi:MAG: YgeY family selenium metabolism-linked hydrolase [Candidatus Hodarchaeales archaeon]|jgi:putative selenium metabolism hydrolase
MYQHIKQKAKLFKQELIDFTRELIAIPSYNGNEANIINRIKEEMDLIGFDDIQIDDMGNLIGQIGTGEKILAIDGHADTVDVGTPDRWSFDPFEGKIDEGIIYGRGACDQKGGLASVIIATKILVEMGIPEEMKLLVAVTVQEENYEGLNWQYIIKEDNIIPDAVLLTEPSNLNIAIGHRGRADLKLKTTGISSHGAAPEKGENAIYKILPIVQAIKEMDSQLPSDSIFGKGNITVTNIQSTSPSLNAVADSASIHIDRRLSSKDTLESVITEIKSMPSVRKANAQINVPTHEYRSPSGIAYPTKGYYPTWWMEESHPLVQIATNAYKAIFEINPKLHLWRFSTNGAATKGIFDIPTIGFGPGNEHYAHTTNDQVPVEHLIKAVQFYTSFVQSYGKNSN